MPVPRRPWTDDELECLRNVYATRSSADLVALFSRPLSSIKAKAYVLRLTGARPRQVAGACDLVGRVFGSWTVLRSAPSSHARNKYYLCRCVCGKQRSVRSALLLNGDSKSCGCLTRPNFVDLTGRRFHRLVVQGRDFPNAPDGRVRWRCLCDCGTAITVTAKSLSSGNTRSCGCLRKNPDPPAKVVAMVGATFGRLTVLAVDLYDPATSRWRVRCRCVCGAERVVLSMSLLRGKTKSCGCLRAEALREFSRAHPAHKRHLQYQRSYAHTAEGFYRRV